MPPQESTPTSPGRGIVWKTHSRLPVRTSNPRTYPLMLFLLFGLAPVSKAAPMMTTSLAITGAACSPDGAIGRDRRRLIEVLLEIDDAVLCRSRRRVRQSSRRAPPADIPA